MTVSPAALLVVVLLLSSLVSCAEGQDVGEQCLAQFKHGRRDFILDTDGSVKDGATYLSSPKVERYKDCVLSCCKDSKCNVAFMERGAEDGLIKSCFLFDCLYKKKYVCRFVRKTGYMNYFLDSVYESDLAVETLTDHEDSPPVANGGSDRVVQPQEGLTLNGFESKDEQGIVSYQWEMVSGNPYAVIEKTSFDDQIIVTNLTSGVYKFQLTVVDTIGQATSTQVTVLVLTPEQSDSGAVSRQFPPLAVQRASKKCEKFIYGGCKGNLNNYLTVDECANACDGSGEKCGAPCTEDQFKCANGCCLDAGVDCDKLPQCSDGSDKEHCEYPRCTEPPLTGGCRHSNTKWYYNPIGPKCVRFNFGGCGGNDNRFDTEENCLDMCRGVTEADIFARKREFEKRTAEGNTGILAIAVVLGIGIVALLAVLGYCFLRGKKRAPQHQRVATNGTQVTTMEDTERLVYNTTTKPI
ncbi:hypothetical protein CRUP_019752 [Coryphaenoides rupestris]|nr:hypothetical protein CRUP_019752 [Coryphaenoides rupestris]